MLRREIRLIGEQMAVKEQAKSASICDFRIERHTAIAVDAVQRQSGRRGDRKRASEEAANSSVAELAAASDAEAEAEDADCAAAADDVAVEGAEVDDAVVAASPSVADAAARSRSVACKEY